MGSLYLREAGAPCMRVTVVLWSVSSTFCPSISIMMSPEGIPDQEMETCPLPYYRKNIPRRVPRGVSIVKGSGGGGWGVT